MSGTIDLILQAQENVKAARENIEKAELTLLEAIARMRRAQIDVGRRIEDEKNGNRAPVPKVDTGVTFWFTKHKDKPVKDVPTPFLLYFTGRAADMTTGEFVTTFRELPKNKVLIDAADQVLYERGVIDQPSAKGKQVKFGRM